MGFIGSDGGMRTIWPRKWRNRARWQLFGLLDEAARTRRPTAAHRAVLRLGPQVGVPRGVSRVLAEVILGRLDNSLTHEDASSTLRHLATTTPTHTLPADTWLTLENLARSIGCFHASHSFTHHALTRILTTPPRTDHQRTQQFTAHLHTRNLHGALTTYQQRQPTRHTREFWLDAGHYLWHWSQHSHGTPHWSPDHTWTTLLTGQHITILGPAPTSHTPPPHPTHIARVIAPGSTSWNAATDPFGGRLDIAYANSQSTKAFLHESNLEVFDRAMMSCFRTDRWRELGISRGRTAHHHQSLLLLDTDKTNMIPLMVWDVLRVPETTVTVAGTTFFASAIAYTLDNSRSKRSGTTSTDQRGSTGELFERCRSFSHHALSSHHTLLALLLESGAITMDREGAEVLRLTTEEYLGRLDELYGKDRV